MNKTQPPYHNPESVPADKLQPWLTMVEQEKRIERLVDENANLQGEIAVLKLEAGEPAGKAMTYDPNLIVSQYAQNLAQDLHREMAKHGYDEWELMNVASRKTLTGLQRENSDLKRLLDTQAQEITKLRETPTATQEPAEPWAAEKAAQREGKRIQNSCECKWCKTSYTRNNERIWANLGEPINEILRRNPDAIFRIHPDDLKPKPMIDLTSEDVIGAVFKAPIGDIFVPLRITEKGVLFHGTEMFRTFRGLVENAWTYLPRGGTSFIKCEKEWK